MRTKRRISLSTHGLVELVVGLGLVLAAFVIDTGATGTVLTFAAGVLVAGLGLGAADALPLEAHRQLDQVIALVLALCAILAASAGSGVAALALLLGATLQLALSGATRWTRPPLTR